MPTPAFSEAHADRKLASARRRLARPVCGARHGERAPEVLDEAMLAHPEGELEMSGILRSVLRRSAAARSSRRVRGTGAASHRMSAETCGWIGRLVRSLAWRRWRAFGTDPSDPKMAVESTNRSDL